MGGKLDVHNCPTCGHSCLVGIPERGERRYIPIGWEDEKKELLEMIEELKKQRDRWEDEVKRIMQHPDYGNM